MFRNTVPAFLQTLKKGGYLGVRAASACLISFLMKASSGNKSRCCFMVCSALA